MKSQPVPFQPEFAYFILANFHEKASNPRMQPRVVSLVDVKKPERSDGGFLRQSLDLQAHFQFVPRIFQHLRGLLQSYLTHFFTQANRRGTAKNFQNRNATSHTLKAKVSGDMLCVPLHFRVDPIVSSCHNQ